MSGEQRRYLSLMVKAHWNRLVYQVECGDKSEAETEAEFWVMTSLFEDGVLDQDTVVESQAG